jgi:hypothetical protein
MRLILTLGLVFAGSLIGIDAPLQAAMSGVESAEMAVHMAAGFGAGPVQHVASLGVDAVRSQPTSPQTERAPATGCKSPVLRARSCRSIG